LANGRRGTAVIPSYSSVNQDSIHSAITNYFAEFPKDELKANYGNIAEAAVHKFGQMAMNGWLNQRFLTDSAAGTHGQQRTRVLQAQDLTPPLNTLQQLRQNY